MPPFSAEQIQTKKQQSTALFSNLTRDRYEATNDYFKAGNVSFDESFIRTESKSQQDFYGDYERKWKHQPEGFLVARPDEIDAQDVQIQNIKLGYKEKAERKLTINSTYSMWHAKMHGFALPNQQVNEDQLDTVYGLKLLDELTEEEKAKKLKKLRKKNPEAQLDSEFKSGEYTLELMTSTMRLATKEKFKRDIIDELIQEGGQQVNPLFKKYMNHFIALAPKLEVAGNDGMLGQYQVSQESKDSFKAFMKRAMEHPVETLTEATSDALYSFRQIPDKLLDKKAMPQKFDEVKEIRDRYKAITDLFESGYKDDMGKAFAKLKTNKEEAPIDNILFAKGLYQRIDADMRYCLEHNKMKFRESGHLVDRRDVKNAHIKVDGNQSAALLRAVKESATKEKRADVERYWDKKCRKLLLDTDDKEVKSGQDFTDTYNIASAIASIHADRRTRVQGKENRGLFDDLKEKGNQLALAIAEIDKEIQKSADVVNRKAEEFKIRPQAKMQLEKFIQKRKRQQIELLDRAAGVINAMNYLALKGNLDANGRHMLNDISEIRSRAVHVAQDKDGKVISVDKFEETEFIKGEMFGNNLNVTVLNNTPANFKEAKQKIIKQFNVQPNEELMRILSLGSAEMRYNFLLLENIDIFKLSKQELLARLDSATTLEQYTAMLRARMRQNDDEIDKLHRALNTNVKLATMPVKKRADIIKRFVKLRERVYAVNKLKKIKAPNAQFDFDTLIYYGRDVAEVKKEEKGDLLSKFMFKELCDIMENYRCQIITGVVESGGTISDLCTEAERSKIKKMTPEQQKQYFETKAAAAENLEEVHAVERMDENEKDPQFAEIASRRYMAANIPAMQEEEAERQRQEQDADGLQNLDLEEQTEVVEYTAEERKARRNKKNKVVLSQSEQPELTEEQQKKNRDYVRRNQYVINYGEDAVPYFEKNFRYLPRIDHNTCMGKVMNEVSRFLLCDNYADFKRDQADLENVLKDTAKTEAEKTFVEDLQTAYKNLVDKGYMEKIIKNMVPEKALKNADIDHISLPVEENNKHYRWFVNRFNQIKDVKDIKDFKNSWALRNTYYKEVYGAGVDVNIYYKVDALLSEMIDIYEKRENAAKVKKNVDGISKYESAVKKEEQANTFNLKDNDADNIYKFDQHQKGSYGCWAASHTYVVNAYMKAHKIEGPKFDQNKFKNEDNFIPNETAMKYMEDQSDQNENSMSFNQEAKNIQTFLAKDMTGNPYITADTVINALPKTAEHHLVFTNFYLNVTDEKKEDVKTRLTDYIMDKIQSELDRTKTPISLLKSGHYLSVVGVNRANKELITMDSLKKGSKIEEPTIVSVSDLIEIDKFELVYPENLEEKNLKYLSDKFGLKEDLYDKEGKMNMKDGDVQKAEKDSLEKPQNMLHVSGVEFERKTRDFDFEENFVAEQIYMPKDLKLKKEQTK